MAMDAPTVFAMLLGLRGLRLAVLLSLAFAWVLRSGFARRRRVLAPPWAPGQLASELRAGLGVLLFDSSLLTALWWALGRPPQPLALLPGSGWADGVLTFAAAFIWYEIWFYSTHRLLHTRRFYGWHRQHHTAVVCSPLTSMSFSLAERSVLLAGLGLFVALAAVLGRPSVTGLLAYALVNQMLNVLGHSNVELAPGGWNGWLVTPTFHALHHSRRRAHFGLFTTVLDRAFGSVEPDYLQALAATSSGRPLQR